VLEASLGLITEVGIDRVRLAEIARRAGMSSGQVMYYFTSKEHILLETLAWQEREETRLRRSSLAEAVSGWPRLELYVHLYLPAGPTDAVWILWMEAWARSPHNAEVSRFLDELARPDREDLATVVEQGTRAGAFHPRGPIGEFAVRFCALLDGLSILGLRQMPALSRPELTQLAMETARAELDLAARPAGRAGGGS
jgi:AcrR family transcriptional regulator